MDTPFIAFAVIALVGLGVLAVVGFDSSITGQPTIPISTLRHFASTVDVEEQEESKPSKNTCSCPNPYANMVTNDENNMIAGLSRFDCILAKQIVKIREEFKLTSSSSGISELDIFKNACKLHNWW